MTRVQTLTVKPQLGNSKFQHGGEPITQTYDAVYENGVFRPAHPDAAPLAEGQRVRLIVQTEEAPDIMQVTQDLTLALFAQWESEAAPEDPAELARRQQEGDALMNNLYESRVSLEGITEVLTLAAGCATAVGSGSVLAAGLAAGETTGHNIDYSDANTK